MVFPASWVCTPGSAHASRPLVISLKQILEVRRSFLEKVDVAGRGLAADGPEPRDYQMYHAGDDQSAQRRAWKTARADISDDVRRVSREDVERQRREMKRIYKAMPKT